MNLKDSGSIMILLCCSLSNLMDFKTRYNQVLQSWFGKKRGHRYFSLFKNYLLDFIVFYFCYFLASRYRNINMIWKEFWVWNCILHSWEVLVYLFLFRHIYRQQFGWKIFLYLRHKTMYGWKEFMWTRTVCVAHINHFCALDDHVQARKYKSLD